MRILVGLQHSRWLSQMRRVGRTSVYFSCWRGWRSSSRTSTGTGAVDLGMPSSCCSNTYLLAASAFASRGESTGLTHGAGVVIATKHGIQSKLTRTSDASKHTQSRRAASPSTNATSGELCQPTLDVVIPVAPGVSASQIVLGELWQTASKHSWRCIPCDLCLSLVIYFTCCATV